MELLSSSFYDINPADIQDNMIKLLAQDWMLVTAGITEKYNTMTASWGGFGYFWNKPVAFVFVRPTRYTYEFTERHPLLTLCFFEEKHKPALQWAGTKSGREVNKMTTLPLTAAVTPNGSICFNEARLIMECRKLYVEDLKKENFLGDELLRHYPIHDYHRMYVAAIETCFGKGI